MGNLVRPPRRRGGGWVRLGAGVRVPADVADRVWAELQAWTTRLPPGAVVTGLSAAEAYGMWLPPLPSGRPVTVALPSGVSRVRRPQVRVSRHPVPPRSHDIDGVRIATVPETILACAQDLALLDLVALIDGALQEDACTLEDLIAVAAQRRRGAPALRVALDRADGRSESLWETLLRMLHEACEVLVEPQAELYNAAGRFLARADLLVSGTRVLQEYDGAVHRERGQYRRDRRRDSRLSGGGFIRHGYVADDVRLKPLGILREADRALGRPHDPARLQSWYALWKQSLHSAPGMASLCERWGLEAPKEELDAA